MYFDKMEFGVRIQKLRTAQGITQEELAGKLGVSKEYVSKMERGIRSCSFDVLIAIACIFHVSTDYLLTGKDRVTEENANRTQQILSIIGQLTELAGKL